MAEKRLNGAQHGPPGTNLLFSASEFNFSVPFIPVSQQQSAAPAVLPADDSTEVGEEDSFLGQISGVTNPPQTYSYFSQSSINDPFASIGETPLSTATQALGTTVLPKPSIPLSTGAQNGQNIISLQTQNPPFRSNTPPQASSSVFPPSSQYCPPSSTYTAPPTCSSQTGYNPYRHNTQSSRTNPYLPPPQLQDQVLGHSTSAQAFAPPPSQIYQSPSVSLPPPPKAAPPLLPTPPVAQSFPRPAGALVPPPPTFMQNLYEPVQPHWFYCKQVEGREIWLPFSVYDSVNLERVYNSVQPDPESVVVSTDGGRYDIYLYDRERKAVFWEEADSEIRRCSWFYKGDTDSKFVPYSEDFSEKLEAEYKKAVTSNQWHRRLEFPGGETIVIHNPKVIVQFQQSATPDEWGTPQDGQSRPRVVKRGIDTDHDEIPDGEVPEADHLVFMVHGIGPVCDLRFRSIVECVDDFRTVSLKLLQTHFKKSVEEGRVSRIEFLPVHWHSSLHGDATGVDRCIKKITLPSIGRLRHFTNETLLDILFYNSPTYCQTIVDKVSLEMNRLYELFMSRNPEFKGSVSVAGHSLGSLIMFDLLSNQTDLTSTSSMSVIPSEVNGVTKEEKQVPVISEVLQAADESCDPDLLKEDLPNLQDALESLSLADYYSVFEKEKIDMESLLMCTIEDLKEMGIPLGPRKKIAKYVQERIANQAQRKAAAEQKAALSALAKAQEEAIGRTEQAAAKMNPSNRALEPPKKKLPVGASVSSVHVDYEYFETGTGQVSVQYNSLDFEPVNFFALGSPIGMFLTVRGLDKIDEHYRLPTCKGFFNIYHPLDPVAYRIEPMIIPELDLKPVLVPHHKGRKRLHLELKESLTRMGSDLKQGFISSLRSAWQTLNDFARAHTSSAQLQEELKKVVDQIEEAEDKQYEVEEKAESPESLREEDLSVKVGMLNSGRRIDYVLQEKPIESFNEYLFALQSHLCYWESEDTALLILKEIYRSMNIIPDHPVH
ncbi:SEC23-interacting protein isoform X2 [Bombina bombina]|uniref:SEC23-interacting protein isoform X2 n=1 Tax=Bombina bombina TaxID=8345 RepID=UPI00235AC075|nr:SEC23-interacting protein isoform X2 [Bombina bombina]